ncbi:MAG TPA: pyridoxamine 5'-phosphate oxidase family protein [Caldisericia bacterium]|jgi:general stress protein 26|nr:MAG: Pyridoxamine 5'-phosphate oxidase [bacterium ADurb.Bin132]HNW32291.1 pyridoxamine 5'-phosphate oxidase family protein [Caldisericia bacterium]HNY61113.1 pyridoxamine 5'-phosphate oxidase family protein [Caldisericia bacterium]HOC79085.1 pyridoxamine 5'-phosphate oxidase family protein [Caldisericia bacterium]HOG70123.1 pyridoxamine 5'-phosphate oxidase family protein [Caldisericia bacterium]
MDEKEALRIGSELVKSSRFALLSTIGDDGHPWTKMMFNIAPEGLKKIYFSTNTSSKRVTHILKDGRASVYFFDQERFVGLLLVGTARVLQDEESRKRFWVDGFERYYKLGVNDPDYSVIEFVASKANLYYSLSKTDFLV